jgi:hypothetical protein
MEERRGAANSLPGIGCAGRAEQELPSAPGLLFAQRFAMDAMALESVLRDATIKAIDNVAKKLTDVEQDAETKVTRLLAYWNEMDAAEKEHAVSIAIATVTTVVTAIIAMRRKANSPVKSTGKKIAKAMAKKMR